MHLISHSPQPALLKTILTISLLLFMNNITTTAQMKTQHSNLDFVPQWAKEVVWYQIFPERFCNGDSKNDPTLESIKGSWPHDSKSNWQVHPWISDWYELQPYEKTNGKDIWYNLQRRRYGGDLQGIINKLDYIKDLGIGAIYLNPVFEAPSLHKYDAATYHHIDPNFGPNPEGDRKLIQSENPDDPKTWLWTEADKLFLKLVDEVHKRGMKIIIDGVFNHMGINSWAFNDVQLNQQNSKYKDWFVVKSWNDKVKGTKFEYEGWFGVKELPELREDENGIVDGPKKYIFDITKRWMDPNDDGNTNDGIDGWRLDVAYCVKHQFWKEWRNVVKSINPEAYLTAEIIDSVAANKPYLEGDEFDAVMNYNFLFSTAEYFIDEKTSISTSEFDKGLEELRNAYPESVAYGMMNLYGSHDTQRILSHIVNKDKYKIRKWGQNFDNFKGTNTKYDTRKPKQDEIDKLKMMLIFQMTYVGAPYVYYGDEVGMWGANDPCSRKPMLWEDLVYENEKVKPDQSLKTIEDENKINSELLEFYKKLIKIRNDNKVLSTGNFKTLLVDDKKGVYAFARETDSTQIIVIINKGKEAAAINLPVDHNEYYTDLLNNNEFISAEGKKIECKIAPVNGRILIKDYYK
ncbi:MAG TPA: alpha-amylase [Ignavibacteriales bacterium]|nr:alpha-amylase [Ignavibacteriales bacterium]